MSVSVITCKKVLASSLNSYIKSKNRLPKHRANNIAALKKIINRNYKAPRTLLDTVNDYLNDNIKTGWIVFGITFIATGRSQLKSKMLKAIERLEAHDQRVESMSMELQKMSSQLNFTHKKYQTAIQRVKQLEGSLASTSGAPANPGASAQLLAKLTQENAQLRRRINATDVAMQPIFKPQSNYSAIVG